MDLFAFLIALLIFKGDAHMGITINDIFPRDKNIIGDNFRFPNGGVCDGTTAGGVQTTIAVGALVTGRTTFGAGHGGGHCAWFISADQVTWYKINDKIDCTPTVQPTEPGGGIHDLVLPANLPVECGTKCVLGWFWSPRFSGGCEIYHDCFDIKVTGITGPPSTEMVKVTTPGSTMFSCSRVNGAGITAMFGAMVGGGTPSTNPSTDNPSTGNPSTSCNTYTIQSGDTLATIAAKQEPTTSSDAILAINPQITNPDAINIGDKLTLPPCSGGTNDCPTYTVQSGDWLSKIAAAQGTTPEKILELNPQMTDPNTLAIGDVLKIPPCTSAPSTNSNPPTSGPAQSAKSCTCADQKNWCQQSQCNFQVQINQCWGSGPFFYCQCTNGETPRHSRTNPTCTEICSGTNCRSAFSVCTLPSTCTLEEPTPTCSDGIKNGQETGIDCGGTCSPCSTYQWKISPWSSCSVPCGVGTQTRVVLCVDANGNASPDKCGTSPSTSQACNTQDCAQYKWNASNWGECNVPCGQGKQFRSIECVSSTGGSVAPTLCDINTIPDFDRTCTAAQSQCVSAYYWKFNDWQYCATPGCTNTDAPEAAGTQLREVFCFKIADNLPTASTNCDSSTKPDNTRTCTVTCPRSYTWKECPLTECSSLCRGISSGFQERQVYCMNGATVVDESFCDLTTKPPTFLEGCNPAACTANYWVTAPLGTCVNGQPTCAVCFKLDGQPGTDSDCSAPKPVTSSGYSADCTTVTKPDLGTGGSMVTTSLTLPITILIFITVAVYG